MGILGYDGFILFYQYGNFTDLEMRDSGNNKMGAAYGLGGFCGFLVVLGVALIIYGIVKLIIYLRNKNE